MLSKNFSNDFIHGEYNDQNKINEFLNKVDVVTYEFENIPYETLNEINKIKPVLPKPSVNRIIQHRLAEKDFINNLNIRTTRYVSIKKKFLKDFELASTNEYDDWQDTPLGSLALVILFDQFSRNMFRDDPKAFSQDHKARLIVNDSVYAGFLDELDQTQRLFMILPLIHSEEITDHDMGYYLLDKY